MERIFAAIRNKEVGIYAGIGSRETPSDVLNIMRRVGKKMAEKEWVLRSGGAEGADSAFEEGCDETDGVKEIYLPWRGFNDNQSQLFDVTDDALEMARQIHPSWRKLTQGGKKLQARNCFQILGKDLKTPVDCVICYTLGGAGKGGTGQALRLARRHKIPIFDFGKYLHLEKEIVSFLKPLLS